MKKYTEQWYQRFISKKYITRELIEKLGGEIHQIGVIYKNKWEKKYVPSENIKKAIKKIIL